MIRVIPENGKFMITKPKQYNSVKFDLQGFVIGGYVFRIANHEIRLTR